MLTFNNFKSFDLLTDINERMEYTVDYDYIRFILNETLKEHVFLFKKNFLKWLAYRNYTKPYSDEALVDMFLNNKIILKINKINPLKSSISFPYKMIDFNIYSLNIAKMKIMLCNYGSSMLVNIKVNNLNNNTVIETFHNYIRILTSKAWSECQALLTDVVLSGSRLQHDYERRLEQYYFKYLKYKAMDLTNVAIPIVPKNDVNENSIETNNTLDEAYTVTINDVTDSIEKERLTENFEQAINEKTPLELYTKFVGQKWCGIKLTKKVLLIALSSGITEKLLTMGFDEIVMSDVLPLALKVLLRICLRINTRHLLKLTSMLNLSGKGTDKFMQIFTIFKNGAFNTVADQLDFVHNYTEYLSNIGIINHKGAAEFANYDAVLGTKLFRPITKIQQSREHVMPLGEVNEMLKQIT